MRRVLFLSVLAPLFFGSCTPDSVHEAPHAGNARVERTVVMGGSFMSGYRNGALTPEGQMSSPGAQIISAFSEAVSQDNWLQPIMPAGDGIGINAKPWESLFQTASRMGTRVDCEGVESLGPVKELFDLPDAGAYLATLNAADYMDFAIPFATVDAFMQTGFGLDWSSGGNPFYHRFAVDPGNKTALKQVMDLDPTFVIFTPGMQELYNYAASGMTRGRADIDAFAQNLAAIMDSLTANGAQGVLATLPDVGNMPYFTTIPALSVSLTQSKADSLNDLYALGGINIGFIAGDNGFVISDTSDPRGVRQMTPDEYVLLTTPLDSVRCYLYGILFNTLGDQYALTTPEIAELNLLRAQMNDAIRAQANQHGWALADLESYFAQVKAGLVVDAADINADFATGNFFSLDGFTPTGKGAALVANQFILAINATYGANFPTRTLHDQDGVLFP